MNDRQLQLGTQTIKLELANTPAEREQGLSGRPCLPKKQGMLFAFNKPEIYAFWMKDMNFSIDIIWADESKKIVKMESYASPQSYPQRFVNNIPAQYVIELKAGTETYYGLSPGDTLKF